MDTGIDWDAVLPLDDIQSAYDKFEEILNEGISKSIPAYKVSSKKSTKPIWMTPYATNIHNVKYRLWAKYKQTRHRGDFTNYTRARNDCTHQLRKARRRFEKNLAKNLKSNSNAFWNYVNSKRKTKLKLMIFVMTADFYTHKILTKPTFSTSNMQKHSIRKNTLATILALQIYHFKLSL